MSVVRIHSGAPFNINRLPTILAAESGLTSESGWVKWSGVRTGNLLNSWRAHKCLEHLIFCWLGRRSIFESAAFHAVSTDLRPQRCAISDRMPVCGLAFFSHSREMIQSDLLKIYWGTNPQEVLK
jgi:hypothetical protein